MALETLRSAPQNVAVEAGYLVIRSLKHSSQAIISPDEPFGDESIEARKLAKRIIDEISLTEHRPVPELGRARVEYYISKVAEAVHARVRESVGIDVERGNALLVELRKEAVVKRSY